MSMYCIRTLEEGIFYFLFFAFLPSRNTLLHFMLSRIQIYELQLLLMQTNTLKLTTFESQRRYKFIIYRVWMSS